MQTLDVWTWNQMTQLSPTPAPVKQVISDLQGLLVEKENSKQDASWINLQPHP